MNGWAALLFVAGGSLLAGVAWTFLGPNAPAFLFGPLLVTIPTAVCVAIRRVRGTTSFALWLHSGFAAFLALMGASPLAVSASVGLVLFGWHTERMDRVLRYTGGEAHATILVRVIVWEAGVLMLGIGLVGVAQAVLGRLRIPFAASAATAAAALLLLAAAIRRALTTT